MVFLDVGSTSLTVGQYPTEWAVMGSDVYRRTGWSEAAGGFGAPIHHGKGTCTSFADGHVQYWKWKDPRTVAWSQAIRNGDDGNGAYPTSPPFPSDSGNPDYIELFEAVFGRR
jgi:prepilin-type processing-associated H-X9-DG protein